MGQTNTGDPDNDHITEPDHGDVTGTFCTTCGGRNGKHYQPCGKPN